MPCKCRGSVAFVHERCLRQWVGLAVLRRGRDAGLTCDMCRSAYDRESLETIGASHPLSAARAWRGRLPRGVAPFVAAGAAAAGVTAAGGAVLGALRALNNVPQLVMEARLSPRRAAASVLPRLLASLLCEAFLFKNYTHHLDSAAMYAVGWALDAGARHLHVRAAWRTA